MQKILMTPGPTNVPQRVLNKMSEYMIHHRTKEFSALFSEFNERLQFTFQTKNLVLTFPAVGTGGLESSIVNLFSKGDKVLAVSIGVFGDRFIKICKTFGLQVDVINVEWGKGVDLQTIKDRLNDEHKALIITHNETSTGATNDIESIGEFMKDKEQLYIVDAVSSLGGIDIKMDEWNIDVLITASQKALMSPPGLTFVGVSEKAWNFYEKSDIPKYYWDYKEVKLNMLKDMPQNPYTPAVSLISATNEALKMMEEEGLDNVFKRHKVLSNRFRKECKDISFENFVDNKFLSSTITTLKIDEKMKDIKKILDEKFNIVIAGGQGNLKNKIIRIGHMGYVNEEMIDSTVSALKNSLEMI